MSMIVCSHYCHSHRGGHQLTWCNAKKTELCPDLTDLTDLTPYRASAERPQLIRYCPLHLPIEQPGGLVPYDPAAVLIPYLRVSMDKPGSVQAKD